MPKKYKPFPDFLYASISAPSKGVSPTATFRPASSVSTDSAWGSATKPRDEKPKKKILITHDTLDCYPLSDVYALSLYLAQNGFDIFVWGPDQNLFQLRPENPAQEAISALESATSFHPKSDYTRCAQVGLAHDQLAVLDAENSIALFQHIHQGELPYGPATQISDFSFIQGYTGEFNHPDLFQHFEANPLLLDDMPIETTQPLVENSFEFVQYFMKEKRDQLKIMAMHFLVKIAARYYEFAQKLINTPELLEKLTNDHLIKIGVKHSEFAQHLLNKPELLEKLSGDNLVQIGIAHIEAARSLLNKPELLEKLRGYDLVQIGKKHIDFAQHLLNKPELLEKLRGYDLVQIGEKHIAFAQHLLNKPELLEKHSGDNLAQIGEKYIDFAQHLLNKPELLEKLSGDNLAQIGEKHIDFAQHLLNKPGLLEKLSGDDLAHIGEKHIDFARALLNTPELLEKLNENHLRILGEAHIEIARMLLGKAKLLEKLIANSSLFFIIETHSSSPSFSAYAYQIIKKASIFKKFLAYILPQIDFIASIKKKYPTCRIRRPMQRKDSTLNIDFLDNPFDAHQFSLSYCNTPGLEISWPTDIPSEINRIFAFKQACARSPTPFPSPPPPGHSIFLEVLHQDDLTALRNLPKEMCSFLSNIAVIKISPFLKDLSESDQKEISTNLQQLSLRCPQLKLIQLPDGFNATHFAKLRPPIIFHKNYTRELLGFTSLDELSAQANPQDTSHPNPGIFYESTPLQSTSIVSTDNQGKARYDMIPIGEALNTTKKINVRGAVIAYKLKQNTITDQAELYRFEPTAITRPLTYQIKYLTLENITLYKEAPTKDEYFKINQRIPSDGQFHRLRSIHPAETLEGIMGNGTELLEFHRGSDDFFYVKNQMPDEINLQFILKLSSEHNKSRLEDLGDKPNGSFARLIINTYRNQPFFQETADSTRPIPKITDSLKEWTEILYSEAAGVCWHRALAVSSIISGAISPDHVRIVSVNQNHEMIEVKNDDNEWIPLDVLGASKAEEHYEATPKMMIPRSISPETWAADEVPNEPITAAHANMRAMLLKQCEIHKISTQEEYTSKISVHKNILLLSKTAKQDALSILRTQADLGIHTFYIQKSNDIDIGKRALILGDTGPNIEPEGGDFSSFLKKATAHPTQRFSILIQWDALTPKERLTLQEMLDDSPRIKGIPVAKNIQIIGLCQNRPEDESFQSRYKGEVYTLPLPLPQAPTDSKREETISSVIDLEGESNWLEKFFGRVILVENKMTFEPGPLFDGIGANQRITLLNIANDQQEAIQYACDIARAQGYFLYHGMMIPIAPTAQFDLSNRNLNFADFEIKQVFRNAPKRALPEAIVVNTHCVDILFQDKCIVEGIYSERPGLLERFRGQHLLLHVNRHSEASDLTESQWYTLFNRAKMYGISLSLYLEPGVSLPRNLTIESDLPADSADKDSISVKETSPSSPLVFNVEDECFSSLFYSVRFTSERAGFSDFAIELGGALSALLAGETVILKGIFSPELLDQLAPMSLSNHSFIMINGERVTFSGTLILQAETARSVPQSPSIIYSESDCSHEDVGTEADSKAFISRRKSALLGVLDQHHIARISGPTGVGKTSLIDEMAKLEQATLYQELDEFEAWALDTSEKIKILRIDEHNIENLHFTFLAPMLAERTPCVLYKGKTYELSETHKVVFAGNDLSYGGGRVSQKLFEDYSIPTLAFQDFPPCYIDHQILKPIFNKMSKIDLDICEAGLLEHDIHTEKTRLLALYYDKNQANPGSMTVRALQNEALQWCTARLLEFREASTTTDKPSSFIEAPYTTAAMTCLTNALIRKDLQREGLLPGQGLGLNGVIIEGMPGLGKSALVQHCLKSHPHIRIPANLLLEEHLHETLKIIATAFDEGKPVWIDEFDACSGEGVEKAINSFLTGRNINGQPAKKEGFLLIVTLNGAALSGRDILSPAFKARCEHVVINPLTASDIQEILEYKYPTDSPEIRAIMTNQFLSLQTSHGLTLRGLLHVLDQAHQGAPAVGGAGGGPISLFSQAPMASDYHTDPGAH